MTLHQVPAEQQLRLTAHHLEQHPRQSPLSWEPRGIRSPLIKRDLSHGVNMLQPRQQDNMFRLMQSWWQFRLQPQLPLQAARKDITGLVQIQPGEVCLLMGRTMGLPRSPSPSVPAGTADHTITVSKSGYQTWSQFYTRNTAADQTISVFATLNPVVQTGNILVSSVPSGASAILDNGYNQLTTAGTFTAVSLGMAQCAGFKTRYRFYSTSVEVKPGITSSVTATLVQSANRINISYFTSRRRQPVCGYHLSGINQPDCRQPCCWFSFGNSEKIRL